MIVTIKFKSGEFSNAHKLARSIKALTGIGYKAESGTRFGSITFDDIFCNSKVSDAAPILIEQIKAEDNL